MVYDHVATLDLEIDSYDLELRERETSSDFTRTTTIFSLHGGAHTGYGEDVTYESEHHYTLTDHRPEFPVPGSYSVAGFSDRLDAVDLFVDDEPDRPVFRNYRRWGLESAALDLALKQAGTDLATRLDRTYDPVEFVASTSLGDPPRIDRVEKLLELNPSIECKLDPTPDWTADLVEKLSDTDAVRILDLKGLYEGTDVDRVADPELYELVLEAFPDAIVEDPELTSETRHLFDDRTGRVSWDYPIRGVGSVEELPWVPRWLNIKPSRFGTIESLFETIEYCRERDIQLYGGGQFELGIGRSHLHAFASLFYPDGPNDVAPRVYNEPDLRSDLPRSPLSPPREPVGLEW